MSEAVRAAVAARRAELRRQQQQQQRAGSSTPEDPFASIISPFGSPKTQRQGLLDETSTAGSGSDAEFAVAQRPLDDILFRSCTSGKVNLSSRHPALRALPTGLFSLLDANAPQWYEAGSEKQGDRRAWYEREDLKVLQAANGEIDQIDARIAEFRGLARVELQNNRLTSFPSAAFQLINLTSLNLSRNALTSVPDALLALDSLLELDLSHNKLESLWSSSQVSQAREARKDWDRENADDDDGMWAGYLERAGSPTKRSRPLPPTEKEMAQPMRSLRILKLSHNRLSNLAFGLSGGEPSSAPFFWPPALVELDLSDNMLRGPLPLSFVGRIKGLIKLSLGGNGLGDQVFQSDSGSDAAKTPFGQAPYFQNLQALDIQRSDIDDLTHLEQLFGSNPTLYAGDKPSEQSQTGAAAKSLVSSRQLFRVASVSDQPKTQESIQRPLAVVLEGNALREEVYRRRHGAARSRKPSTASPEKSPHSRSTPDSGSAATPSGSSPAKVMDASSIPIAPKSQVSARSTPQNSLPKEDPAFAHLSEGAKRRLRIEAARREEQERQEVMGQATTPTPERVNSVANSPFVSRTGRRQPDGINRTGLSDWDGTPEPIPSRFRRMQRGDEDNKGEQYAVAIGSAPDDDFSGPPTARPQTFASVAAAAGNTAPSAGSTLASTKLTKRQSEALSRVPCKFFKSAGGCSAGDACPFAHIVAGEGSKGAASATDGTAGGGPPSKAVCEFFLKDNCRFAHKCALAHVREGEPMSMDRKNKKAAQQGRRGSAAKAMPSSQSSERFDVSNLSSGSRQQATASPPIQHHSHTPIQQAPPPLRHQTQQHPYQNVLSQPNQWPGQSPLQHPPRHDDFPFGLPDDLTVPISSSSMAHPQDIRPHQQTRSSFIGSPPGPSIPTTNAFGSSPFGQSVFYSGSQDSEGAGPFARSIPRSSLAASSFSRLRYSAQGNDGDLAAADGLHSDEGGGEDFLPSSLSDLLTPAELERQRRGRATAVTTQSMPAPIEEKASGFQASLWDLTDRHQNQRDSREYLPGPSNSSLGFLASRMSSQAPGGPVASQDRPTGSRFITGSGGRIVSSKFDSAAPPIIASSPLAATQHLPGSSLPQGLAAGLSRLHLTSPRGDISGGQGPFAGTDGLQPVSEIQPLPKPSLWDIPKSSSRLGLDEFGLAPVAPSSVLPHHQQPSRGWPSTDSPLRPSGLPSSSLESASLPRSPPLRSVYQGSPVAQQDGLLASSYSSSPLGRQGGGIAIPAASTLSAKAPVFQSGNQGAKGRGLQSGRGAVGSPLAPAAKLPSTGAGTSGAGQVGTGDDEVGLFELE